MTGCQSEELLLDVLLELESDELDELLPSLDDDVLDDDGEAPEP